MQNVFARARSCALLVLISVLAGAARAEEALESAPEGVDARAIALRAEESLRSDRTYFKGSMTIRSPRLSRPRVVAFESWGDQGGDRSMIRIHAPAKDAGTGFLKLHPNLWMYVPRVERTVRIPPSMMLQSWMGSDFTNDDLVRESSEIDDYDHRLLGVDPGGRETLAPRAWVVEYTPHEDTAVVWGRIVAWLSVDTGAPLRQEFYDEQGEKIRVIHFSEIREQAGRHFPHRWALTPLEKPGHSTTIEIAEIQFDADFDDGIYTTRHLERGAGRVD
ncbi:outer membrane lipoprotein-sorting protein [Myxococcota bacterium]|nr:outer membrane lipoprotein-sorting protein [Myxococcota bacterium]